MNPLLLPLLLVACGGKDENPHTDDTGSAGNDTGSIDSQPNDSDSVGGTDSDTGTPSVDDSSDTGDSGDTGEVYTPSCFIDAFTMDTTTVTISGLQPQVSSSVWDPIYNSLIVGTDEDDTLGSQYGYISAEDLDAGTSTVLLSDDEAALTYNMKGLATYHTDSADVLFAVEGSEGHGARIHTIDMQTGDSYLQEDKDGEMDDRNNLDSETADFKEIEKEDLENDPDYKAGAMMLVVSPDKDKANFYVADTAEDGYQLIGKYETTVFDDNGIPNAQQLELVKEFNPVDDFPELTEQLYGRKIRGLTLNADGTRSVFYGTEGLHSVFGTEEGDTDHVFEGSLVLLYDNDWNRLDPLGDADGVHYDWAENDSQNPGDFATRMVTTDEDSDAKEDYCVVYTPLDNTTAGMVEIRSTKVDR